MATSKPLLFAVLVRAGLTLDPPDWWTAGWVDEIAADMERANPGTMKAEWEDHLRTTWRALGILDVD